MNFRWNLRQYLKYLYEFHIKSLDKIHLNKVSKNDIIFIWTVHLISYEIFIWFSYDIHNVCYLGRPDKLLSICCKCGVPYCLQWNRLVRHVPASTFWASSIFPGARRCSSATCTKPVDIFFTSWCFFFASGGLMSRCSDLRNHSSSRFKI